MVQSTLKLVLSKRDNIAKNKTRQTSDSLTSMLSIIYIAAFQDMQRCNDAVNAMTQHGEEKKQPRNYWQQEKAQMPNNGGR